MTIQTQNSDYQLNSTNSNAYTKTAPADKCDGALLNPKYLDQFICKTTEESLKSFEDAITNYKKWMND